MTNQDGMTIKEITAMLSAGPSPTVPARTKTSTSSTGQLDLSNRKSPVSAKAGAGSFVKVVDPTVTTASYMLRPRSSNRATKTFGLNFALSKEASGTNPDRLGASGVSKKITFSTPTPKQKTKPPRGISPSLFGEGLGSFSEVSLGGGDKTSFFTFSSSPSVKDGSASPSDAPSGKVSVSATETAASIERVEGGESEDGDPIVVDKEVILSQFGGSSDSGSDDAGYAKSSSHEEVVQDNVDDDGGEEDKNDQKDDLEDDL